MAAEVDAKTPITLPVVVAERQEPVQTLRPQTVETVETALLQALLAHP
jgi:hypothetical protein